MWTTTTSYGLLAATGSTSSSLLLLQFSHLFHHLHEVAHASQLLNETRVYRLRHLLHELLRVTLHRLEVIAIVTQVHLPHLLDHDPELVILLQEEHDLLGVGPRALGYADDSPIVEGLLNFTCGVKLFVGHGVHHAEEALDAGGTLFLTSLGYQVCIKSGDHAHHLV